MTKVRIWRLEGRAKLQRSLNGQAHPPLQCTGSFIPAGIAEVAFVRHPATGSVGFHIDTLKVKARIFLDL